MIADRCNDHRQLLRYRHMQWSSTRAMVTGTCIDYRHLTCDCEVISRMKIKRFWGLLSVPSCQNSQCSGVLYVTIFITTRCWPIVTIFIILAKLLNLEVNQYIQNEMVLIKDVNTSLNNVKTWPDGDTEKERRGVCKHVLWTSIMRSVL